MADVIRVNTELLERCANELKQAAHGFADAASILNGLNTGEEWWEKIGGFSAIRLEDEGGSATLSSARSTVSSLSNVMRRYDSRLTRLGNSVSRAASLFESTENSLTSRANRQGKGEGRDLSAVLGTAGLAAGAAAVAGSVTSGSSALEDEEAKRKDREKKAKMVKYLAMGACLVGGIALTVVTAGAASPLVVGAISGAATGALMGAVNRGADLYVEGGWSNVKANKWDIGKEALIGGIKGAVTGAISGGIASKFQGVTSIFGKAAVGSVTKVTTGIANRSIDAVAEGLQSKSDAKTIGLNSLKKGFDLNELTKDALTGGIKGGVSATVGSVSKGFDKAVQKTEVGKKVYDAIGKNAFVSTIKDCTTGALKEASGGAASRYTKARMEGKSREEAAQSAFDSSKVGLDAFTGAATSYGKEQIRSKEVPLTNTASKNYDKAYNDLVDKLTREGQPVEGSEELSGLWENYEKTAQDTVIDAVKKGTGNTRDYGSIKKK